MDEPLTARENIFQKWMIYTSKCDITNFKEFIQLFVDTYQEFIDVEFTHLKDGFTEEGPHLTYLPTGILEALGNQLSHCSEQDVAEFDTGIIQYATSILKCLIIVCRNHDNVPLVASCEFVSHTVVMATKLVDQICCSVAQPGTASAQVTFVRHALHFFECLYDPYFVWRKRLCKWKVDRTWLKSKPAFLHVEVIPFFHECFQKKGLSIGVQLSLLHLFGAIMSGAQHNALRAITPATVDVLLKILSSNQIQGPTNEQRQDMLNVKDLVLKCIIRMVQVIHCSSPDQRQVEVGQVMEGYLQVLLGIEMDQSNNRENQMQLPMISAINEMLICRDKGALQVIFVTGGTFDAFISLLLKTSLTGTDAQTLAMSVLKVVKTVLTGSPNAKEEFGNKVGYIKFVESLKSLGQPSMELLKAILDLIVETEYDEKHPQTVHNSHAALMLLQWLPDIQSHDLQLWLSQNLQKLCGYGHSNKINCCNVGMISAILNVLSREKQISSKAVGHLINLLEILGTLSITSFELKQLISLLKVDEEDRLMPYCGRLMRAVSTMARREGKDSALHFFNILEPGAGIVMPAVRKWPGCGFSFHTWLCLDSDIDLGLLGLVENQSYRRLLYSFSTSFGSGFESFFTPEGVLVIAVYNRKDYCTVSVADFPLKDSHWHCVDIVHMNSRRPFASSQLMVFIDGCLRLNSQLKFPNINEPFTSCKIGSPCLRSSVDVLLDMPPISPTAPEPKKNSPLKFLFQASSKSSNQSGVTSLPGGTQDDTWGIPISLIGQLGSVCIFHEALNPAQIKILYSFGPNYLNIFAEDGELSDLPGKLLFYYNAKACKDGFCIDLSANHHRAHLHGQRCTTWDVKDVINCIGGIQVLFPLLEQVNKCQLSKVESSEGRVVEGTSVVTGDFHNDWVFLSNSSYADSNMEQNQVAGFLTITRNTLQTKVGNQDCFIRTNGAATVGALLQKVNPVLIDVHVLMAVQLLVEMAGVVNTTLLHHLYQFILFDFRIWSSSDFPVRIGHIQYIATIIKDERKYFRKKYGVQYILDVIRTYYSSTDDGGLSEEDAKTIRGSLLGLIKFYIAKEITYDELQQIMGFLVTVKEENLVCEVLDMLIGLTENPRKKQDQLFLLMFEPEMSELFYVLLTNNSWSTALFERVLKLILILLKTDKVYEKSKNRLRLNDIGHSGILGMMHGCDVSPVMIKHFIEQVTLTDSPASYSAVLSILQLVQESNIDIKLEASRQVLSLLVSKQSAPKNFAKQLSWQEIMCKLFIHQPKAVNSTSSSRSPSNPVISFKDNESLLSDITENFSDSEAYIKSEQDVARKPLKGVICEENLLLDMNASSQSETAALPKSPATPLYEHLKNDYWNFPEGETEERSMSRSSSTSVEDLSNIAQRVNSIESQSNGILPNSENTNNEANQGLANNRRNSLQQAELFQKALDNLGIQKIYVRDSLEKTEEFTQIMLIIILTIMWKGVEGSDNAAWWERGQVFSVIDKMNQSYQMLKHPNELKRQLLEMMLHSCTSDLREAGQALASHAENAFQLVRITQDFTMRNVTGDENVYSERLIEDLMTLLDALHVWDTHSASEWKEMVYIGFRILLSFACQPDLELCAVATARLHSLVQTRILASSAEASFLIGTLSETVQRAVEDSSDTYSFLIPVLKALIDKSQTLLNMHIYLPNLPATSMSPTFFDDFRLYGQSEEWKLFIDTQIKPQMQHFIEKVFLDNQTDMIEYWSECHEVMMVNMHKRNRDRGDSKLHFQNQILNVAKTKSSQEQRRFQNVTTQLRNQHSSTIRQWRASKQFFTGKRGAWADKSSEPKYWKLSSQENFSRMRAKLIPNYNFDPHIEPSKLRDNQVPETNDTDQLKNLSVAKEALVSKENIADDALGDEDWNVISSASTVYEEYSGKEKLVLSEDCELVTIVSVIRGRLEVTTTHVYFFDCSNNKEEGGEDFKWALSQLREIHFRRYNLRRSALELFLIDQTNYFLNFQVKKVRNKVYSQILSMRPPNLIYHGTRSPAELLKASGLTQKWVLREISNFDYLMQLNTIAGRTYNDLSQYPVFPWILCDYQSETLDLEDESVFRNLCKPIGVVNSKNEAQVQEKYEMFEDPTGTVEKFHYGTHYSNAAGVMHCLIRMEPFTTLHIQLQSGRFDVADRQFHSIPGSWQSVMENPNDVKELIPEFFYLPEFLLNLNGFDLGKLQITKEPVTEVILPRWADSPEDFIYKHRKALECEHVSNNLHHWIDLIFGYKQKGLAAVEAYNVFYYCTYEGAVDLDAIKNPIERKALEGMINNFGQTPCQLLKEPHLKRMSFDEVISRAGKSEKPVSILYFVNDLKTYFVEVSNENDPVVYICVPRIQARSIIQHGMPDSMVTITEEGCLGIHGWLSYDKSISNYFTFEKDPTLTNSKTKKRLQTAFAPGLQIEPKLFVVSHDAKLLFTGGHWDNSLQVFHLGKWKKMNHIIGHIDIVSCLALDYCGSHLITGSRDTTCMIWQVLFQGGSSYNLATKPIQILYGHDAEVSAVHISTELDMAVSASKNFTVIIHTVRKGHYMRTLEPPCDNPTASITIPLLGVSDVGQICLYSHETNATKSEEKYSLHLYTINGKHLFKERVQYPLSHMVIAGDYLITGNNQGHLVVVELFGLCRITTVPLLVPIQCISMTPGNTHMLVGLRDGKLIIVGNKTRAEIR